MRGTQELTQKGSRRARPTSRPGGPRLNDPVLDSLIQRALHGNLDLKAAVARVDRSLARASASASGDKFPSIDTISSYQTVPFQRGDHS